VVGVSFHVGSGNSSPDAYYKALRDARDVFDRAEALGHEMRILDIGGGFSGSDPKPGSTTLGFEQIAAFVRPVIDELFPPHVHVIAEPGRYFAESPYAIAMCIHSKRKITKRDGTVEHQYYTSDGKYGSFNCMLYDHQDPGIHVLHPDAEAAERTTTIFGPTCDGVDWIMKQQKFPALDIGDWIFSPDFGAYTVAAGSKFNGFATRRVDFISSIDVFAL
jgi:ornithine decarboxylase